VDVEVGGGHGDLEYTIGVRRSEPRRAETPQGAVRYNPRVLRQGPIPFFFHGVIEYVAGIAFVAAPFVLSYDSDAARGVSILIGLVILAIAASTDSPTSLVNSIPVSAHVVLDYVLAVLLVALPFLAGFYEETEPTAFFIALGVAHLLITIGTRFRSRQR